MRGGRDVSAARSGGRARREKPQKGLFGPAHSLDPVGGGNITTRPDGE